MKKQKNLKIDENILSELQKLSEERNVSQSEVVEEAIQKLAESYPKASRKIATENDVLIKQLEVKDKQIEQLQKALDQEQQLHAATKQEMKLLEQPKKRRWKFWE